MKHYPTILFDLDDTLVDFRDSESASLKNCHAQFFSHLIAKEVFFRDYHQINQALWQQVEEGTIAVGTLGAERFRQLADLHRISLSPDVRHYYEHQLIKNSRLIEGASELLDSLLSRKVNIGFITNGFTQIQRGKYQELGLSRYSDILVVSEEVGCSKPHPQIFHHILEQMRSTPADTLMVGDSLTSDGEGARGVKMPFCWYNPNRSKGPVHWTPAHVVHELRELRF